MAGKTNVLPTTVNTNVTIGDKDEKVLLLFGQSIAWLEMEPVMAIKIAEMMKEKAIEILRSTPKP